MDFATLMGSDTRLMVLYGGVTRLLAHVGTPLGVDNS